MPLPPPPTQLPPLTGAERGRPVPRRAEVVRTSRITPRLRRVVVGGDDLAGLVWSGPAAHVKLILPGPGQSADVLPPAGARQPVRLDRATQTLRTYTPRAWDPQALELTVDMVLHGDGPAARWAATAAPGAPLAVTSPLGRYDLDPDAAWLVLAADETALPAVATILEVVPAGLPTVVLAEVLDADDHHDLGARARVDVEWLHRHDARPGRLLAERLRSQLAGRPADEGRVWVACESGAMLAIRRHLLDERGLSRRSVATRGYWTLGAPDGDEEAPSDPGPSRWLR